MFEEGVWIVRANADATYGLDCTPERAEGSKWRAQLTVYRDQNGEITAHTAIARALVFDTAREAAEAARAWGERWVIQHGAPAGSESTTARIKLSGIEPQSGQRKLAS